MYGWMDVSINVCIYIHTHIYMLMLRYLACPTLRALQTLAALAILAIQRCLDLNPKAPRPENAYNCCCASITAAARV